MSKHDRPIGIGIAGLGQAGAMLLPALERHSRARLVAAADPLPEARERFSRDTGATAYDDIARLCSDPAVEAVYIATPTPLHTQHALLAAEQGKHIVVEKPMALTLEDADEVISAAERAGVQIVVGHSQSFEPPIRAMRRLVTDGSLGRLFMLHTWYYTDWLYRPRRPEELDTALGGGVLFRQGAHQADLLRWIGGGMVRSVRAAATRLDAARPTEGSHVLFLEFAGGVAATAVFSGYDHFQSRELTAGVREDGVVEESPAHGAARAALRVAGSEDLLKAQRGYRGRNTRVPRYAGAYGLTVVSCERGDIRQSREGLLVYGDDRRWEVPVPALPSGRDLLLDELCDAIVGGLPSAHDGRWGKANLEVCLAALESTRTHAEVPLRHQVPTPGEG